MADHDLQVIFGHESGLPEDVFINTLHYNVNIPDTLGGTMDDIAAAYTSILLPIMPTYVSGLTIKSYPPGPNPGGPEEVREYAFEPTGAGSPAEVALCLSYATVDDPESSTPRRRGRIYLGPIAGGSIGQERPSSALRAIALNLGEGLASAGNAGNTTWLHYSRRDNVYTKIESIWCDDTWDTQRRRGKAPTLRDVRDVQ